MNLNSLRYSLRQGVVSLRRNALLALVTTSMVAVSLAILGGFMLLSANVRHIVRTIESNVEIAVFADMGANANALRSELSQLQGVSGIVFVPREVGLRELGQSLGDPGLFQVFTPATNPLPDVFRVRVQAAGEVSSVAEVIRKMRGVDTVDYGEELVAQLLGLTRWISGLLVATSALLGVGAIFLVIAIIRLSVMARQEEIGVMKYLGASNSFIRLPFVLEGTVMGFFGAVLASLVLWLLYDALIAGLQGMALPLLLNPVTGLTQLGPVFGGMLVLGTSVGAFGSILAVRKYLRNK
ncbi:MAG: Cell division protein FtsX [Firmicutes bacterium]|nr:Cell division protein FtsX [candidate division NPL-UPA2 bacterium]